MNKRITIGSLIAVAVLAVVGIASSVNIHGNLINADTGYEVNATAGTTGQALCSNGTIYNSACTFATIPSNACTSYASTASAGCTVMADGKWEEWATGPSESANFFGNVTISLPVTLPTACYAMVGTSVNTPTATSNNAQGYNNYFVSCSTTSVTLTMDVGADSVGTVSHSATAFVIGD